MRLLRNCLARDAQGVSDFENGSKTGVTITGERFVEIFMREAGVIRYKGHSAWGAATPSAIVIKAESLPAISKHC